MSSDNNNNNNFLDNAIVFSKKYGLFLSWLSVNLLAIYVHHFYFEYLYIVILPIEPVMKLTYLLVVLGKKIWRIIKKKCYGVQKVYKEYANDKFAITVTCYSESVADILLTIDSLVDGINYSKKNGILFVIFDGLSKEKGTEQYTWEIIMEKMETIQYIENIDYKENWKQLPIKINLAFCKYKDVVIVNVIKQTNLGKTDSLTFTRDLLTNRLGNNISNICKNGTQECGYDISDIHFCGSMDADCTVNPEGVEKLYNGITEKNMCGVSGLVYPKIDQIKGFWEIYQHSEYFSAQLFTRLAQSILGQVTCLPGALNIFDLHMYTDEVRNKFLTYPKKRNLYQALSVLIGEDRRFTGLSLYHHPGTKTRMDTDIIIYTTVPNSFRKMKSQRRRWMTAAFINDFYDLFASSLHPIIRLDAFCNLITLSLIVYIYYVLIRFTIRIFLDFHGINVIYFWGFTGIIITFMVYKLLNIKKLNSLSLILKWFIGELIFIIIGPLFFLYMCFKCLLNLDDLKWGNIKQNQIIEYEDEIRNSNSTSNLQNYKKKNENEIYTKSIINNIIDNVTKSDIIINNVNMDEIVEIVIE